MKVYSRLGEGGGTSNTLKRHKPQNALQCHRAYYFVLGQNPCLGAHFSLWAPQAVTGGHGPEILLVAPGMVSYQRWSPRGRPWPRGYILKSLASKVKSLALASKLQVLENCPVLGSRTALFFEQLKFRWKTPETSRKICEHLFCFPHVEHRRRQGEGGRVPPQLKFHQ